jgi:hypothetical protein
MSEAAPKMGHNLPQLSEVLDPAVVSALIEADTAPLKERAQALIDSCKRFVAAYPAIEDDEADGIAASLLAQVQRLTATPGGRINQARIALKAPALAAQKQIDAAYPPIADGVTQVARTIIALSTAYKVQIEHKRREAAEAEALRKREEAAAAERLAASGTGLVSFEDAATAHQQADAAQAIATARPADLTRTHGSDFGTSSLRYKRVVRIVDPAAVDRLYCVPDLAALQRAAGKAGTPLPTLKGCTVVDEPDLTVRR